MSALVGLLIYLTVDRARCNATLKVMHQQAISDIEQLSVEIDSIKLANAKLMHLVDSSTSVIDSLDQLILKQTGKISWLNDKLESISVEIENILVDSIYSDLQYKYDTIDVDKPYMFSEPAIRGIYKDISMLPYMDGVIVAQDSIITVQDSQLKIKEDIIKALGQGNSAKQELINSLYNDMTNMTIQHDALIADNKRIRNSLKLWKSGSLGAGAALVLILLII